ncbi:MAG: YraN family protein [Candidatus Parcubacteria bacterium]|nr:YraN family protein [Candidatus Parcubacteria bacterium]
MSDKIKIGSFGQDLAKNYLLKRGYRIYGENFRILEGELDLIAAKDGQLIFIEVKTRLSNKYGLPEEAVDKKKLAKMQEAAFKYMTKQGFNSDNYRYDLVAVLIDKAERKAIIRHYKSIA